MSRPLKKKSAAPKKPRNPNEFADLGLFNIPDLETMDDDDEDSEVDESVLESELEAILSGKPVLKPTRPVKKAVPPMDIEMLAAECMKDPDDSEEDNSNIEMDEDLLKELHSIAGDETTTIAEMTNLGSNIEDKLSHPTASQPTGDSIFCILEERLNSYNEAVKYAKSIDDGNKTRRYGRAIKTLESLLKSAKSGRAINEEDIPPVVNVPKHKPQKVPYTSEPLQDSTGDVPTSAIVDNKSLSEHEPINLLANTSSPMNTEGLTARRDEYKNAAVNANKAGNKEIALKYMKTAKAFDAVIEAAKSGQPIDLTNMPPPPTEYLGPTVLSVKPKQQTKVQDEKQTSSPSAIEVAALSAANEPEDPKMFDAPPPPTTVLEALQQRLEKYASTKQGAEAEGNTGKVRRLQRIIKLYETAIKDHKAGKSVDFESLPTPPGFAPIPVKIESSIPQQKLSEVQPEVTSSGPKPQSISQKNVPQRNPKVQRTHTTSIVDKQLEFLLERQKMFRQAALAAKKNGDIQQAKEYLRMSKGFDSMIEATRSGLRIDASAIPTPPQLESDFVVVDVSDCVQIPEGSNEELLATLEEDLLKQIKICSKNKEHFLRYGDVSSASKFERSGLESKKDLSVIQHLKKSGSSVPKFHYETRLFSIVHFNDLADNELEVTVLRGINLPGRLDMDSFIKIEFPIPSEAVQRAKTQVVRGTNNPCFQESFKFEINRKSRAQLRQFKRQALKLEVFSRGCFCCSGFLKSDTLLGTVNVKLVDLESKCSIHDSFNLMDGRKPCGGKLEVKVDIREPLLGKQVEEVSEKWLVIGS